MVKLLAEPAPAKINLFLRVVGRRADGYHELDSVFVPVSLCDQVRVEIRIETRNATDTTIALGCDREDIPTGAKNLAWRAADAFLREFAVATHLPSHIARPSHVRIDLRKAIPIGAGLGGGSSDAGAVLRMMAALCRVDDPPRLARVALALGADVPFFLSPHIAHVSGVGERIAPLEPVVPHDRAPFSQTPLCMVIAVPPVEVSTAEVFRALKPTQWSGPATAEHLAAIAAGAITPAMLQNDLAAVAMARYPEIAELKSAMIAAGAVAASMSGSGGAVFGIFPSAKAAARAAAEMHPTLPQTRFYVVNSLP
jgi:4-diphosphocytidyl-2-C-methyl-D-erythritol kinase